MPILRRPYDEDEPGECLAHDARPASATGPACYYPHPTICPDHEVQCEVCGDVILRGDAVVSRDVYKGRVIAACIDKADCQDVVAARQRWWKLFLESKGYLEGGRN